MRTQEKDERTERHNNPNNEFLKIFLDLMKHEFSKQIFENSPNISLYNL
jgi:hypothetical protein